MVLHGAGQRGLVAAAARTSASSVSSSSKGNKGSSIPTNLPSSTIRIKQFPSNLKVPSMAAIPISLGTACQKDITSYKVSLAFQKFQKHVTDSGSPTVQIAVATEKILNMARHTAVHRKDKHSNRGFQMMVARRKKMMKYLKRTDFQTFKETVAALGLEKEASHIT